jgi:uncharacterized membrane protein
MTELIVAGFADTHTVFMARAALARLQQDELGLATDDVAMALRGSDGNVAVQQTLNRDAGEHEASKFWQRVADLLFAPKSSAIEATEVTLDRCDRTGIDPASANLVFNQLKLCQSALLVRTRDLARKEQVVGVLRGLGGELARVSLKPSPKNKTEPDAPGFDHAKTG